jgi:kynurenine formamidase
MKKVFLCFLVMIFVLTGSLALAGAPFGTNWGKWGEKDQLGTLNYITPQKISEAAALVKKGKVFNLALDLKAAMPGWPGRSFYHYFAYISTAFSPEGGIGFSDDVITMHLQYSTQWDGFPHSMYDKKLYNGYSTDAITPSGTTQLSVHQWADKIVSRGVLLDIARLKKVDNLAKGYIITPADLEAAAAAQKVTVKPGDIVLIRTGWMKIMKKWPLPLRGPEIYELGEPGLGLQGAKWLKDKQVAAVAFDNIGGEPIPFDPEGLKLVTDHGYKGFPLHVELLVNQGMPLGELWDLDALADDCAADGVYEFLLIAPPLRVVGSVGSVLSPIAIK